MTSSGTPPPGNPEGFGPLQLLVIQPTPYCNLDCDYCYLPNRDDRHRLPLELLEAALERVLESPYVGGDFTLLWHAGEPRQQPDATTRATLCRHKRCRLLGAAFRHADEART